MNYCDIGRFIQERRKLKKLTQKELASIIGVTDKAVSKWERGLGCPDVSILEILSKELDCSILELLKGREIEGEVISVTLADDYIKKGIKYGESNFKTLISKFIVFIFLFIFTLLVIFNAINISNQRKTYEYNFDLIHDTLKNKVNTIKQNINIIKRDKGIYSKDDYKLIIKGIEKMNEDINNNLLIKYEGIQKLTINDLYIIDNSSLGYTSLFNISSVLEKYDSSIKEYREDLAESYASRMFLGSSLISESLKKAYKYEFTLPYITLDGTDYNNNYYIIARVYDINYVLSCYQRLTNMIIEVGDIYE